MQYVAIKRSAQSVLHTTFLSREEADRVGTLIADLFTQSGNYEKATVRYNTNDEFEIGERAAKEYVSTIINRDQA